MCTAIPAPAPLLSAHHKAKPWIKHRVAQRWYQTSVLVVAAMRLIFCPAAHVVPRVGFVTTGVAAAKAVCVRLRGQETDPACGAWGRVLSWAVPWALTAGRLLEKERILRSM